MRRDRLKTAKPPTISPRLWLITPNCSTFGYPRRWPHCATPGSVSIHPNSRRTAPAFSNVSTCKMSGYALTLRVYPVTGEFSDITYVRWPYRDGEYFEEFLPTWPRPLETRPTIPLRNLLEPRFICSPRNHRRGRPGRSWKNCSVSRSVIRSAPR